MANFKKGYNDFYDVGNANFQRQDNGIGLVIKKHILQD